MYKALALLLVLSLTGCKSGPSGSAAKSGDKVQQKLQELAGSGASDCGRLKSQDQAQMQTAGSCAMQAAQNKRPFYVAYDLPGLTVGVAGNADGKLFSVQAEQAEGAQAAGEVNSGPCAAELRIAQSGRVTCAQPGSMGTGGPHGGMGMPPAGTQSPHDGMAAPTHEEAPKGGKPRPRQP